MSNPELTPKEPDLYSSTLLEARSIFIFGEISQKMALEVCRQLLVMQQKSDDPMTIYINSQGGHVEAGDTIHDMIRFVKPKVYIIGTGWVASAGVNIFLAVDSARRLSLPNTRYMIHQPSGGVHGATVDINIEAKEILKIRQRINTLISQQTGKPFEQVQKDTERNFWMSAQGAIDYGIVGKIISSQDELDKIIGV